MGIIKGTPAGHDGRVAAVLVAVEVCQINWQTNGSDGGREVDGDHLDQCDVAIGFEVVILAHRTLPLGLQVVLGCEPKDLLDTAWHRWSSSGMGPRIFWTYTGTFGWIPA